MGALPRPDLRPGAHRELVDALHDPHHRAGWPSLRVLARAAGCSHTTVSTAFSSPRLPSWGLLELVVEAMSGDVAEFRRLWLAAGTPGDTGTTTPPIAGRVRELGIVRHHLREGTGLLLVTGEAGMGKTRLVGTAAGLAAPTTFVALGSCLPLSIDVPLLPVADLLRATYERDAGRWVTGAVDDCAPYVAGSLQRLLPELEPFVGTPPAPENEWSRQRLFAAVGAMLEALAGRHPFAVLLEDLHWADAATLDLLSHLIGRRVAVPVLGTWRTDDPAIPEHAVRWWTQAQHLPRSSTLSLRPLSGDETAEQLTLLGTGADPELVKRIHRRSQGQPLFTEQLARQPDGQPMPQLLTDLLDRRLDGLGGTAWSLARALAVADRALDDGLLADITRLDSAGLSAGLHELADRHLLRASSGHRVELGHPLQAEAIRRRLVTPEALAEHRRMAEALARTTDPSPAEIAEHWQRAEDADEELVWRIRAAKAASERFALAQAGAQWRHVLALWPGNEQSARSLPLRKGEAYLAALDALVNVDVEAAWLVAEEALRDLAGGTGPDSADLYKSAALIKMWLGEGEAGLPLVDRAIALHEATRPSVGYVRALHYRDLLLDAVGRYDEARAVSKSALTLCRELDEPVLLRSLLIQQAVHETTAGDLDRGLAQLDAAAALELTAPDPEGDIYLAVTRTYLLETAGRVGDEVVEAGRPGLDAARAWGFESIAVSILRANMATALRLAGEVRRAGDLIDALPLSDQPTYEDAALHNERADLDLVRGHCDAAVRRYEALAALPLSSLVNRIDFAAHAAVVDLWSGRPRVALDRLVTVLRESMPTGASRESGAGLAVAMRAAADLAGPGSTSGREAAGHLKVLQAMLDEGLHDPFEPSTAFPLRRANGAAWEAERARLTARPALELWGEAARQWEGLHRPHDAAYCRWRGAQEGLRTGQGTIALRLLRRAAREARGHIPLATAIAETAAAVRFCPRP
jgi:tetratricopeptide (TPR) repeat protein